VLDQRIDTSTVIGWLFCHIDGAITAAEPLIAANLTEPLLRR
jgi:hypothetical protein